MGRFDTRQSGKHRAMNLAHVGKISGRLYETKVFREHVGHAVSLNIILLIFFLYFRNMVWPNHGAGGIFCDLSGFGSSKCDLKMIEWTELLA